jgi:hypothetical protein
MNTKTNKKVCAIPSRLLTASGRVPTQAALILAVLLALVPLQLLAQNAVPLVNQPLVPSAVVPGGSAFTLTINGTGFAPTAVVKWNGSARATNFISSSKLAATIPAADIATATSAVVTVTNPTPAGGVSNPVSFLVAKPATGLFISRNDKNVNDSVQAVATGDFRGIGRTDLVLANSANSIDVYLGNSDGSFAAPVNYPFTSGFPVSVIVADFNGDGAQDLAVLLGHTHQVTVLLGNGDGSFGAGSNFATGSNPNAIIAADVNKDGNLDLITTNFSDSTISVLLGNGDGTFQVQQAYGTGTHPVSVAAGDFNGDGKIDLAVVNNGDNTVSILPGTGNGSFPTHVDYDTAGSPTWVVAGDFNGDGKLDLGVSTAAGKLSVLLNHGDGTLTPHADFTTGHNSQYMIAVDANTDGKLDLATADVADNTVSFLQGVGDGTFKARQIFTTFNSPAWLVAADFNRDGKPDFAVTAAGELTFLSQGGLAVSPTVVQYDKTEGGFAAPVKTITLRNAGTTTIGISNSHPAITGANPGDFSYTTTCGSSLAKGATCTYSITFTPQDFGVRQALINVPETDGTSVGLTFIGTGFVRVAISPDPHTFPTTLVGATSAPFTATFKNYSKLNITLNDPPFFELTGIDTGSYAIQNQMCPHPKDALIGPLATCTMQVVFKPTRAGSQTAALTIFGHFSPGNGQQAILMSGIGTAIKVTPAAVTFGNHVVGVTSAVRTVTILNAGNVGLAFTANIQGTNAPDFKVASNSCGTGNSGTIPPNGGTCVIGVTFTAKASGARSGTLNIGDSDPTGPQIIKLTGNGE